MAVTLVGQWTIEEHSPFFAGHFPGQPILPAIAQFVLLERVLVATYASASVVGLSHVRFFRTIGPRTRITVRIAVSEDESRGSFEIVDDAGRVAVGRVAWRVGP